MGAGKSVLTRAAARGMGVEGPVPSPTFTILNIHEGSALKLYHFDLYRIEDPEELFEIGFEGYLTAGGICVIEWPQIADEYIPEDVLSVTIERDGADTRIITIAR